MVRMMKWIAPVAGLALVLGFNQLSNAADGAPATGKATVNVTVVDKDGKGVENVRVRLVEVPKKTDTAAAEPKAAGDAPTEPPKETPTPKKGKGAKAIAEGTTDKDGKVALANVPDGDFTVMAAIKGGAAGKETVKVEGGKDATVTVTLKDRKPKGGASGGAGAAGGGEAK